MDSQPTPSHREVLDRVNLVCRVHGLVPFIPEPGSSVAADNRLELLEILTGVPRRWMLHGRPADLIRACAPAPNDPEHAGAWMTSSGRECLDFITAAILEGAITAADGFSSLIRLRGFVMEGLNPTLH